MRKENSWSNYFNLLKSLQCRQATFRKKNGNVDEKMLPDTSGLVTASVLNTKTYEAEDKILDTSNLMISTFHNPKNWRSWEQSSWSYQIQQLNMLTV